MNRLGEVRDKPDEEDPTRELLREIPAGKNLRIENLSFKYDPLSETPTLDNINLEIAWGKQTAIVGMSGSGKTTLVKLLLGFYPPAGGGILLGDTPLENYSIREWRKRCGVVMQDGFIFSDSIAGNIAPGVEHIDKERLRHAAKVANIHRFIEELPLGYSTRIGQAGKEKLWYHTVTSATSPSSTSIPTGHDCDGATTSGRKPVALRKSEHRPAHWP